MAMKTFTCPKCGGTLQHDELKDILSCPYCGAAVEKESGAVEKIIRYKERKAQRELDEKKREEEKTDEWLKSLRIVLIGIVILLIVLHFIGNR